MVELSQTPDPYEKCSFYFIQSLVCGLLCSYLYVSETLVQINYCKIRNTKSLHTLMLIAVCPFVGAQCPWFLREICSKTASNVMNCFFLSLASLIYTKQCRNWVLKMEELGDWFSKHFSAMKKKEFFCSELLARNVKSSLLIVNLPLC